MQTRSLIAIALLASTLVAAPALSQAVQGGDTGGGVVRVAKPVTGAQIYEQVCQACHMADAKGGAGAATIPALAGNRRLAASAYPIAVIVNGKGAMPSFTDHLGDEQIAEVVTYVRTHFGNAYPKPVTAAEVAQIDHPHAAAGH